MANASKEMRKAIEIAQKVRAIAKERDDALDRARTISLSNHRLFGALAEIGTTLLDAKRTGSFGLEDVLSIIDKANREGGRSSAREFVDLLQAAVCPECGSTGGVESASDCDFCRKRSSFAILVPKSPE